MQLEGLSFVALLCLYNHLSGSKGVQCESLLMALTDEGGIRDIASVLACFLPARCTIVQSSGSMSRAHLVHRSLPTGSFLKTNQKLVIRVDGKVHVSQIML